MKHFRRYFHGLLIFVFLSIAGTPARADSTSDWVPVAAALDAADKAYAAEAAECLPDKIPPCSSHDSAAHQLRLTAYSKAKDSLTVYMNKWSGDPNWNKDIPSTPLALKLLVRMALVSSRAEDITDSTKYYRLCLLSRAIDTGVTTTITGNQQLIKDVSLEGLQEQCKDAFQTCNVQAPADGTVSVTHGSPWTRGGSTSGIALTAVADEVTTPAPDILGHVTVGEIDQVQKQINLMAPQVQKQANLMAPNIQ